MPLGLIHEIAPNLSFVARDVRATGLRISLRPGLAVRLALVVAVLVLFTGTLVQLPSLGQLRGAWLADRVAAGISIVPMLDEPGDARHLSESRRLLESVGLRAIDLHSAATHRNHVIDPHLVDLAKRVDLRQASWLDHLIAAVSLLEAPPNAPLHVVDDGPPGYEAIEVVVDEAGLRKPLASQAARIAANAAIMAALAGAMVFLLLRHFVVQPLRNLSNSVTAFAEDPERAGRPALRSTRTDEIGVAERAVSAMQCALGSDLRHKRRLATLGLSVCKINHELRNQLSTAQLLGDRLENAPTPVVRQVTPRLSAAIDRATRYCEATLAYGRAAEQPAIRRIVPVAPLIAQLADLAGLSRGSCVGIDISAPPEVMIDADPEQLLRALTNLVRNAVQALDAASPPIAAPEIRIAVSRKGPLGQGEVAILVSDNGPGMPMKVGASLFAPFQVSARAGGTGLGLAIADELVRLNGGTLRLERSTVGACFRIVIPDRAQQG